MRRALALAVPAIAAALIAGCGSSGSSNGGQKISLARAASVSTGEPGYQVTLAMNETLSSTGRISMTGSGSVSTAARAADLTLNMSLPSNSPISSAALQVILRNGTYYVKLPSQLTALIPGGKQWMSMNLNQLGGAANVPGLGSVISSEGSLGNPGQYLDYLAAASSNGIKNLGSETIGGVKTTHYRAVIELSRLANVVPAADRAAAQQLVTALQQRAHVSTIPADAWIDSSDRVRRIELSFSLSIPSTSGSSSQNGTIDLTENFTSYGPQSVPAAPPADQTISLASLLHGLP